jgi:hypothetical protein
MSKLAILAALALTIVVTALTTAVVVKERTSHAQQASPPAEPAATRPAPAPPPPEPPADFQISAYFDDAKAPTNGFVVLNRKTGRVSNCVANWQGKADAKCYEWKWVKLP